MSAASRRRKRGRIATFERNMEPAPFRRMLVIDHVRIDITLCYWCPDDALCSIHGAMAERVRRRFHCPDIKPKRRQLDATR